MATTRAARSPGAYVYRGRVWCLSAEGKGYVARQLLDAHINTSPFGDGLDGELYAVDLGGGGIYKLVRAE